MTVPKPLPQVDPGTAPYWDGLREGKFLLKSCRSCGKPHFYPRESCPHCDSADLEWTQASGLGEIYSFTVSVRPAGPAFAADAPYVIAIVALDEGPRMMTWILDAPANVAIGKRVRLKPTSVSETITLPMFELCD
jgi:uncharacterized OB-fold protein